MKRNARSLLRGSLKIMAEESNVHRKPITIKK